MDMLEAFHRSPSRNREVAELVALTSLQTEAAFISAADYIIDGGRCQIDGCQGIRTTPQTIQDQVNALKQ